MLLPQIILVPGLLNDADLWRDQIAGVEGATLPVLPTSLGARRLLSWRWRLCGLRRNG